MTSSLTAIDCFSGAGGITLGLMQAGFSVLASFDNNRRAVDTYKANFGNHIICEDARRLSGNQLLQLAGVRRGEIDLVAGGPPCQGFSVQRRGGETDPRNDLIFEFLRIVQEIEPKVFLMENVSALAGPKNRRLMDLFNSRAKSIGYCIDWSVVNSADYGVPQARKRLVIVGRQTTSALTDIFKAGADVKLRTVRDAIGDLPDPGSFALTGFHNHEPDNISELNRRRISHVPPGGGREDIPADLQLPCHAVSVEKAGHRGVFGRLWWDRPATTITTKCNSFTRGRFAHPEEHRNITMREAARLQGFPDDFVFIGGKVDIAHQVGNAVPPPMIAAIAHNISVELLTLGLPKDAFVELPSSSQETTETGAIREQHSIAVAEQSSRKSFALATGVIEHCDGMSFS